MQNNKLKQGLALIVFLGTVPAHLPAVRADIGTLSVSVYITVDGKPTASKTDAQYMTRWIDRLIQVTEKPDRYQSDMERAEVRAIFQKARQKYEGIALKAEEFRPD